MLRPGRGQETNRAPFRSAVALATDVDGWDPRVQRISLLTLHASKGLEWPVVFIIGCDDGILPLSFGAAGPDDPQEECRLFYVGMTRARQRLYLYRSGKRVVRGRLRATEPSPFLASIADELCERVVGPGMGKGKGKGRGKRSGEERQMKLL